MSQHFLLSPAVKTLSLVKVMRMSHEEARDAFRNIRFADTDGEPYCPECGCCEAYDLKTRQVYKCKGCAKQYSLTSGTIFASRKLAIRDILAAIAIFINGAKGYSALQLSRDLSVDYKTAFVLLHKVRESIEIARDAGALSGSVEVDGAYFGGYVKPANEKKDRKDRRKKVHQSGKRQSVIVMRERGGRTLTYVTRSEAEGVALVAANVTHGTVVHADEASHWDKLAAYFPIKRINHQEAYSRDGACTNQAESFFSRLRRAEVGTHHHIAGKYLGAYAAEMAWREDVNRQANGHQFAMVIGAVTAAPVSRQWAGYWQRHAV
ncbi:IS1595 family transposase [uncultured Roseobacter sp.]|uniref:IS1595 family transposase n=1 Tax=uncultured Roseobacter sp. TaxID=114847 RepID=UPI00260B589C|nr:IS1595 family transposase [uncultured Roseobacter sp.]